MKKSVMINKNVLMASAAFALFGLLIYIGIKIPQVNLLEQTPTEKMIEFKGASLIGWDKDKKLWEVQAERVWSTKNQNTVVLENVKNGIVFKKGRVIVRGLKARRVTFERFSKNIQAFGVLPGEAAGTRTLEALVDIANISSLESTFKKPRFIWFAADHASFNPNSDRAEASGNIVISEKGLKVFGGKMEILGKANTQIAMTEGVRMIKGETKISGDSLRGDFENKSFTIEKGVKISQKDKAAVGDSAVFSDETGEITLSGSVTFLVEKGGALLDDDAVDNLHGIEAKDALKEKTLLSCDTLKLSVNGNNAEAIGSVDIRQKEKRAKSDRATYDGGTEEIVLTGNVLMQKENQWLKTQKIIVSVSEESFEAMGQVEAEFKIQK